jgi:hypothetical protein
MWGAAVVMPAAPCFFAQNAKSFFAQNAKS